MPQRQFLLAIFIAFLITLFVNAFHIFRGSIIHTFPLATPYSTLEGNFASFAAWRHYVHSNRYYYCGFAKFCASGYTLPFRKANDRDNPRIFLYLTRRCPKTFRKGVIYQCSRVYRSSGWLNSLHRNKHRQLGVYREFEQKLEKLIANGTTPSELGCPTDESLESLYLRLNDYYPETFHLETMEDAKRIMEILEGKQKLASATKQMWIFKPNKQFKGLNTAVRTLNKSIAYLKGRVGQTGPDMVVQRFIDEPMLFDGKKFQFRTFAIVFSEDPLIVTGHIGHMRVAFVDYYKSNSTTVPNSALLTNMIPKNKTKDEYLAHYVGHDLLNEYLQADPEHRAYTDHNGTKKYLPENVVEAKLIPHMMDVMRTTMSATYTISEKYIIPIDNKTLEEVGWKDAAFTTKVCFDFVVTKSGELFLTEENHQCGHPSFHGSSRKLKLKAKDSMPTFKKNLVWSLDLVTTAIREKMYFQQQVNQSYSLDSIPEDAFGWHVPLIDNSALSHLPREHRMFCNARLYDPAIIEQKMKQDFPQYKTSGKYLHISRTFKHVSNAALGFPCTLMILHHIFVGMIL